MSEEIRKPGSSLPVSSLQAVGARPWPQGSLRMDSGRAKPTKALPHSVRLPSWDPARGRGPTARPCGISTPGHRQSAQSWGFPLLLKPWLGAATSLLLLCWCCPCSPRPPAPRPAPAADRCRGLALEGAEGLRADPMGWQGLKWR